jgi:holo-[acyl-carrier protein] synthase
LIFGIGVDIVHTQRMERWCKQPHLLERYFHPDEIATSVSRGERAAHSLAGRFAAKEAFGKALGTGLAGIALKDIMVTTYSNGRPELRICGTALEALKKSRANRVHLSISHDKDNAVAMVVLEVL